MRLRRTVVAIAAVLGLSLGMPVPPAGAATLDSWPSPGAGAGNAAYNPGEHVVTQANAKRIRQAWQLTTTANQTVPPTIVGGVLYYVDNRATAYRGGLFTAVSVRTGARLWQVELPPGLSYDIGISVVGHRAVLTYSGYRAAGGVTVVDLSAHRMAWSRAEPGASPVTDFQGGMSVTDGQRVYQIGPSDVLIAYRLADGAIAWTAPARTNPISGWPYWVNGIAAAGGVVYTGGEEGVVAFDASTGRRLWSGPGDGIPTVAGGRVISATINRVIALPAAGCGRPTCAPLWTRDVNGSTSHPTRVGGASATTLFVSFGPTPGIRPGYLERLSAATGQVQWSAKVGPPMGQPIRAGGVVWMREGCISGGITATCLRAMPATGNSTATLFHVALPRDRNSASGGIVVSGGTVVDLDWSRTITGYRVPGT